MEPIDPVKRSSDKQCSSVEEPVDFSAYLPLSNGSIL